jgi:hypothetical protein
MFKNYQSEDDPDVQVIELFIDLRKVLMGLIKIAAGFALGIIVYKLFFNALYSFWWALLPFAAPFLFVLAYTIIELCNGYLVDWVAIFKDEEENGEDDYELVFIPEDEEEKEEEDSND